MTDAIWLKTYLHNHFLSVRRNAAKLANATKGTKVERREIALGVRNLRLDW